LRVSGKPFHNYFCPSAKLLSKDRHGAKIKRRHDRPMTPCDRLLASPDLSDAAKEKLRQTRAALNPFDLQRRLDAALRPILQRALRSSRLSGSLHSAPIAATPPIPHKQRKSFSSLGNFFSDSFAGCEAEQPPRARVTTTEGFRQVISQKLLDGLSRAEDRWITAAPRANVAPGGRLSCRLLAP
jgi:hypothetical protein